MISEAAQPWCLAAILAAPQIILLCLRARVRTHFEVAGCQLVALAVALFIFLLMFGRLPV